MNIEHEKPNIAVISEGKITAYSQFYPFYLSQHSNIACRRLHVVGSVLGLSGMVAAVVTGKAKYIALGVVAGYACAWVGHFVFEKNKPATFKQPLYSFISDWRMLADVAMGRISLTDKNRDSI